MIEGTRSKIEHEAAQIDWLLSSSWSLLEIGSVRAPDLTELAALATVLHSFYNGVEGIFGIIAKEVDRQYPKGADRNRKLLDQMMQATDARGAVIDKNLREVLLEYLAFRHFFRHSHSFKLDWSQIKSLVMDLNWSWQKVKTGIKALERA